MTEAKYLTFKGRETEYAHYDYENNTLIVRVKPGLFLEKEDMKAMLDYALEIVPDKPYYSVVDLSGNVQSSGEAREFHASSEHLQYRKADALIVKSLAMRIVVNFYLRANKPKVPTRMFNSMEGALKWVAKLREKEGEPA